MVQWSRDTPEGEVPGDPLRSGPLCTRLRPGHSASTRPSSCWRTGGIDRPERASLRSRLLSR